MMSKRKFSFKNLFCRNSDGSTIVQMLVITGVIGGLSLAVSTMINNINKTQTAADNAQFTAEVDDLIEMALRTNASCRATVSGTARVGEPGAVLASGSIIEQIGETATRDIARIGQVLGGESATIQGASAALSSRLTVEDIRLITANDDEPITSYVGNNVNDAPEDMSVASATIRVLFTRGDDTEVGNESLESQRAYGTVTIVRDYPIRVIIDGTNSIVSCHAGETGIVENFCRSIDARYRSDGKCLEIQIEDDALDPTSNYAITSRQAMLVRTDGDPVKGGLVVGNTPVVLPTPGDMVVQGDATIGVLSAEPGFGWIEGNATVDGNMLVEGTAQIDNNVTLGIVPAPPASDPRLLIAGTGARIIREGDGSTLSLIESAAPFSDSAVRLDNRSSTVDSFRVDSTTSLGHLYQLYVNGFEQFSVSDMGVVRIPRPAATTSATAPESGLTIGGGVAGAYYAWKIFNQPANPAIASHWQIMGDRGDEVATKRWAALSVYSFLQADPESVGNIAATMVGYSTNNQLLTIRRMICENTSRINVILGSGHAGSAGVGTFDGTTCTYNPVVCSSAGNRCGNLHVRGVSSTGEIFTSNRVRLAGAGAVILNNNGTITATNTISSSSEVRAVQTMRGTSGAWNAGVCTANGCTQSLGRQLCPNGLVMIGWDRGVIACGSGYW